MSFNSQQVKARRKEWHSALAKACFFWQKSRAESSTESSRNVSHSTISDEAFSIPEPEELGRKALEESKLIMTIFTGEKGLDRPSGTFFHKFFIQQDVILDFLQGIDFRPWSLRYKLRENRKDVRETMLGLYAKKCENGVSINCGNAFVDLPCG